MDALETFIGAYGYPAVFAGVLLQQLVPPIPAEPVLLGAGALAGAGHFNPWLLAALAIAASVLGDHVWYEVGRRGGPRVLRWLCRLSIEPDTCVRRRQDTLVRRGAGALVLGKLLPGFNGIGQPLAGVLGVPRLRFFVFDVIGTTLWVGLYFGLGYVFREQLVEIAHLAKRFGGGAIAILVGAFALYLAIKLVRRHVFMRELRVARISPEELQTKLSAGEPVFVVDLRHQLDVQVQPVMIRGAVRIAPATLEEGQATVPRDREIVLYCS